jgi:hypothetical protein
LLIEREHPMHRTSISNLEDAGIYTLAQLAERTTVPRVTLQMWVRKGYLAVVKIDGANRSTVHAVRIAAEEAKTQVGRRRTFELEPAEPEVVLADATA